MTKNAIILILSLFGYIQSSYGGQPATTIETKKQRAIAAGVQYLEQKEYDLAVDAFLKAYKYTTTFSQSDAIFVYQLGSAIMQSSYDSATTHALPYLIKAIELDSVVNIMAPLSIYLIYREKENCAKARQWIDYVLTHYVLNDKQKIVVAEQRRSLEIIEQQLIAGKMLIDKKNIAKILLLDSLVNSEHDDYFPSLAADESILYFTSDREGSMGGLQNGKYNEDLWFCEAQNGGNWSKAQNMGRPVNIENNNGIAAITGDGQTVICCRCNEDSGWGSCDLYQALLSGKTWSLPQNMGTRINTSEWDAQPSISADGKILVWSSKREGGLGGQDIWWSKKDFLGHWLAPQNIGAPINTSGEEHSPFIMPDGKTLYFSSDNLSPRIGRLDIYKSSIGADGLWSVPENLGYPINTEANDRHFVLSPSGLVGYFSSDRVGGFGKGDIYQIQFPTANQTAYTTFVGYVSDAESKVSVESDIRIEDLDTKSLVGEYKSNSATGKFVVVLIPGRNYALTVTKNGYLFYSENFNIATKDVYKRIEKQVFLQKIKVGGKIVLNNVFFDSGKSTLRKESGLEIEKLYKLLIDNKQIRVEISGHTDNVGNSVANQKLSQDRAMVVTQALITKGIASERLQSKGYGQTQPIAPNTTAEGRQQNRRTEFLIVRNN